VPLQGLLKTASVVTLFFPLLVLAVPILDTSFVVARRLKYRQPVYVADRAHLHHRFVNIGFSQRRAAAYIWLWCGTLAATALSLRFIKPHQHGDWHPWRSAIVGAIGLVAFAASVYMVYLLEIVKLANPIIRRREEQDRAERKTA
jgi:UDP-GlcNAc:undecaprenyl-phosphate GlcNAc-1-phosphate transferase